MNLCCINEVQIKRQMVDKCPPRIDIFDYLMYCICHCSFCFQTGKKGCIVRNTKTRYYLRTITDNVYTVPTRCIEIAFLLSLCKPLEFFCGFQSPWLRLQVMSSCSPLTTTTQTYGPRLQTRRKGRPCDCIQRTFGHNQVKKIGSSQDKGLKWILLDFLLAI